MVFATKEHSDLPKRHVGGEQATYPYQFPGYQLPATGSGEKTLRKRPAPVPVCPCHLSPTLGTTGAGPRTEFLFLCTGHFI